MAHQSSPQPFKLLSYTTRSITANPSVMNNAMAPTEGVICLLGDPLAMNTHMEDDGSFTPDDDKVCFFAQGTGSPPTTGVQLALWLQHLSPDDIDGIRADISDNRRFQANQKLQVREYTDIPRYNKAAIGDVCGHSVSTTPQQGKTIYWRDIYKNIRGVPALELLRQGKLHHLPFNLTLPLFMDQSGNTDEKAEDELPTDEFLMASEEHDNRWRYTVDFDAEVLVITRDRDGGDADRKWEWSFQRPRQQPAIRTFMLGVEVEASRLQSSDDQAPGGSWQMR